MMTVLQGALRGLTNLPIVFRTLQLPILGVTATPVASKSDFRVLWGFYCHFPLEFEDIATFPSFKPPFRIPFLFYNTYI